MISKLKKIVVALVAGAGLTMAQAATVQINFDNPIFGGFAANSGDTSDAVHITFSSLDGKSTETDYVAAGRFSGKGSKVSGVYESIFVDNLDVLYMYCYDLYHNINHGDQVDYTIDQSAGAVTAGTLDFLGAVNSVLNTANSRWDNFAWLHPANGAIGAAIQLGIWETEYDKLWELTEGNFSITYTNELMDTTANYLGLFAAAMSTSESLDPKDAMVFRSGSKQSMIAGDPQKVPEPGSLALLGLALAGVAAVRRRSIAAAQA